MRILVPLVLLLLLFVTPAFAQDTPGWDFFGGFSVQHTSVREYFKSTPIIYSIQNHYENLNGWNVGVTENLNSWLGGTFDASGHYQTVTRLGSPNREQMYSFLYGPKFSWRTEHIVPFAHLLVGLGVSNVQVTPVGPHASDTSFAFAGGGGVDLNLGSHVSARLLQVEYFHSNGLGNSRNNYRAAAGIVFHTGSKK
jgi:opacity protein-like surface antigen